MGYPTNVKIIRIPCTGKVDALYLLKALEDGVDGVYVAGCEVGDCHFLVGNIRARKRVGYVKSILKDLGINPGRVEMYNMSAADGPPGTIFQNEDLLARASLALPPVVALAQALRAHGFQGEGLTVEAFCDEYAVLAGESLERTL